MPPDRGAIVGVQPDQAMVAQEWRLHPTGGRGLPQQIIGDTPVGYRDGTTQQGFRLVQRGSLLRIEWRVRCEADDWDADLDEAGHRLVCGVEFGRVLLAQRADELGQSAREAWGLEVAPFGLSALLGNICCELIASLLPALLDWLAERRAVAGIVVDLLDEFFDIVGQDDRLSVTEREPGTQQDMGRVNVLAAAIKLRCIIRVLVGLTDPQRPVEREPSRALISAFVALESTGAL